MPCASNSVAATSNKKVDDLLFVHPITAASYFEPKDKGELVTAILVTAQNNRSMRAIGSNWAISSAGMADNIVDTNALRFFLGQPCPFPSNTLAAHRIRAAGSDFLAKACARDSSTKGRHFVHVEAGIKLKDLLADLASCGLSIPTMGDGAGQSIAGMSSTATHGGDLRVPPLVEWIRAVHLVGPTGQELWLTPTLSPFAYAPLVTALPNWCSDARIVADDDAFNAVRVGVGRFGIVYSLVLEVVPQFTLIEVNLEHRWSTIRPQLIASQIQPAGQSGLFNVPLTDLDSGFFRSEVLQRTYYPAVVPNEGFTYEHKAPRWLGVPAYFDAHPDVYFKLLTRMGLANLAADLRGGPVMPLHHINIVLSLSNTERCWIRRRWRRAIPVRDLAIVPPPGGELITAMKTHKNNPPGIVKALKEQLEINPILNFFGWLTHDPRKQRLDFYLDSEIANIAAQHAAIGATSGEALFLVLHRVATDPILNAGQEVAQAVSDGIAGAFAPVIRAGPASGGLHKNMLDAHDYGLDGAQAGDSAEFHFDAATGTYIDFVDDVVALAQKHFPVFGYIGIRFTPQANALMAMQQFPWTASVEVATPRTRLVDVYGNFWNDVHNAAKTRAALPHWGQAVRENASEIEARYGEKLTKWRTVLTELSGGKAWIFRTAFSQEKGLEPLAVPGVEEDDSVEQFMAGLEAGVG